MVAIVAGSGLGLFNTSLNILGGAGVSGQGMLGQSRGRSYVNAATGNLVLRVQDEQLSGRGLDLQQLRTYNSLGTFNDGDADGWRWDGERTVVLSGTINAAGSTVTRTAGDGHATVYTWNTAAARYMSSEGDGAHDFITYDAASTQWIWTDGTSRLVERYAAGTGWLASQIDNSGNTIAFTYDSSGRLATVVDSGSGQKIELVYAVVAGTALTRLQRVNTYALAVDASGRATSTLGAAMSQVEYGYDTSGRLTSVKTDLTPTNTTDSSFYITTYTYDGTSTRIASVSQSDGSSASFTYQLVGSEYRVQTVTDLNGTQTFTYDTTNRRTDVTDGNGQVWSYFYDASQQLIEVRTPAPVAGGMALSTKFHYDANGNVDQATDARGNKVVYEYDAQGNKTLERDAAGNTARYTYNTLNQVLIETRYRVADPDGAGAQAATDPRTTRFVYDSQSRLRFVVSAEGRVSEYRYGTAAAAYGLLTHSIKYAGGLYDVSALTPTTALTGTQLSAWVAAQNKSQVELSQFTYDFRGNLSRRIDFAAVDAAGAGVLDAAATVLEFIYSGHGELLQTIAVRGAARDMKATLTSTVYDGLGRELQTINEAGTRTIVYDDANRRIQVTNTAGLVETSTFDTRGRLSSVSLSGSSQTRLTQYVYDAAGRLRMTEDAQGSRRYSFYDNVGRLQCQVDSTGAVTGFEYNATGQLIAETRYGNRAVTAGWYNTATQQVTKNSLTVGATGSDVVVNPVFDRITRFDYDVAGRMITQTDAANTVTTTFYDGLSQVVMQQVGERVARYFYDRDGNQVGVVDALGYLTENKLDAAGRVVETVRYSNRSAAAADIAGPVWVGVTNQTATGGKPFQYRLPVYDGEGDALTFSAIGTLPSWLTLDTSDAGGPILKGTPPKTLTSYDVTLRASDGLGKTSDVTVRIAVVNTAPTWTELPDVSMSTIARVNSTVFPAATDNETAAASLTYSIRSPLPAGLSFDPATRALSGVPTTPGTYTITARVMDAQGLYVDKSFTLTVPGPFTWTGTPMQELRVGQAFSLTVPPASNPNGGSLTYAVLSAPAWLTFNAGTRTLSGTPPSTSSFETIVLMATDSVNGSSMRLTLDLNVRSNPLSWSSLSPLILTAGAAANYTPPPATDPEGQALTYSAVSGLPSGLLVNAATGAITGTTNATGFYTVTLRVTDPTGACTERTIVLQVNSPTATPTLPAGSDALASWRPTNLDGLRRYQYYDAQGVVVGSVDEQGFLSEVIYDEQGGAQQNVRYFNAVTVGATDTLATLKTQAGAAKQTATTEYDAFGRVSRIIGVDGTVTRNEYDAAGRLVREIRADGTAEQRATRVRYNAFGEVTGTLGGVGEATLAANPTQPAIDAAITTYGIRYEIDSLGRRIKAIDANNNATLLYYDRENRLTHTVNARGEVTATTYNRFGEVESVRQYATRFTPLVLAALTGGLATDAFLAQVAALANAVQDSVTTSAYDRRGLLTSQTDAEGFVTSNTYNFYGQLAAQTRTIAQGKTTTTQFDYDLRGQLLSQTADVGGVNFNTQTRYDAYGRVIQSVDATGKVATTTYLDGGRAIQVTDALNRLVRSEYDAFGRVLRQIDANGQATTYAYDDVARSIRVTTPEGIQVTTNKTRHGETLNVIDGRGNTTAYEYDKDGRVKKITDALGNTGVNTFDNSGRLFETADARGTVTRLSYDAVNRVIERRVDPNGLNLRTTYEFDALGRQIKVTEGVGGTPRLTTYKYDRKGQVTQVIVDPSGLQLSTRYTFDGVGNAVKVEEGSVASPSQQVTLFVFDSLGRRVKEISAPTSVFGSGTARTRDITTEYRYDAAGRVSRIINANGNSTWFIYDAAGQQTHVINAEGEVTQTAYDANGRVAQVRSYYNRLSAATVAGFGDVVSSVTLAVNGNDRRSYRVYDNDGRQRFTVSASISTSWTISENRYDANGNVIETRRYDKYLPEARINAIDDATTPGITVDEVLAELTTLGYSDVETTLAKTQRTRFAFDSINRLRFTVDALGSVSETVYDSAGNVVASTRYATRPTLTDFSESAINAAVNRTDAGNQVTRFSYDAAGRLRYTLQTLASDTQGNSTQHLVSERIYDALGNLVQAVTYANVLGPVANYDAATLAAAISSNPLQDRRSAFVYDAAGRQVYSIELLKFNPQLMSATHLVTRQVYDALGHVTQTTSFARPMTLANYTKATVDTAVSANTNGEQDRTTDYIYDTVGRLHFMVAPDGALSEKVYDALGQVIESRRFDLRVSWFEARTESNLSVLRGDRKVPDKNTRGERYIYDRAGRVLTAMDPRGYTEIYEYNALGDRTSRTDKTGAKWTYYYDRQGQLYREISPAVSLQLSNETAPASRALETRFYRDAFNNLTKKVEAIGTVDARTTDYIYDRLGRLTTTVLPGFYDPATGKVENASATGRFRRDIAVTFDTLGNVVRTRTRIAANTFQYEYKTYDALGRVVHDVDAMNRVTAFTYTTFGQQQAVTRHSLTITGTPASGGTWTAAEIAAKVAIDPSARTITTTYDTLGRKIEVKQPTVASYYYSAAGTGMNAASVTPVSSASITRYEYNSFGEVHREQVLIDDQRSRDTWHYYDQMGREIRSIDAYDYHIEKVYDALGNLVQTTEFARGGMSGASGDFELPGTNYSDEDRITDFVYDSMNQQVAIKRHGMRYWSWSGSTYVETVNAPEVATTVQALQYDKNGKVLSQADALGNVTSFEYNAVGQLTKVTEPARLVAAAGAVNPFAGQVSVAPVTTLTLDAFGNAIRSERTVGLGLGDTRVTLQSFDAVGNVMSTTDAMGNTRFRQYDYAGRVRQETQAISVSLGALGTNSHTIEKRFSYDATGRQVAVTDVYLEGTTAWQSGSRSFFNAFGEVIEEQKIWGLASWTLDGLFSARQAIYAYDNAGHLVTKTAFDGVTQYYYDLTGAVTRQEQRGNGSAADGTVTRVTETYYDQLGRAKIQRMPSFTALVSGSLSAVTPFIEQQYDRWNNVVVRSQGGYIASTGVSNRTTLNYEYNADNKVIVEKLPGINVTKGNGTDYGALMSHEIRYDILGRAVQERDVADNWGTTAVEAKVLRMRGKRYDSIGQLIVETDATNVSQQYVYDGHGNKVGTVTAGAAFVDTFDKNGNILSHGILRGANVESINLYQYDQANRRFASANITNAVFVTAWSYAKHDERGLVRATLDADGMNTTYNYDYFGNKTLQQDMLGNAQSWIYHTDDYSVGQLQSTVAGGRSTAYQYNDFGQVAKEIYSGANNDRTYAYHDNGLLKDIFDRSTFGTAGSVGGADYATYNDTTHYEYTYKGERAKESFVRTGTQEIATISSPVTYVSIPIEQVTRTTYTTYDTLGRMVTVTAPHAENSGDWVNSLTYSYDELGNRRRIVANFHHAGQSADEIVTKWFDYDAEGRVTVADGELLEVQGFPSDGPYAVQAGKNGVHIFYDQYGRRSGEERFIGTGIIGKIQFGQTSWDTYRTTGYSYNDLGHLQNSTQTLRNRNVWHRTLTSAQQLPDEFGQTSMLESRQTDMQGNVTGKTTYSELGVDAIRLGTFPTALAQTTTFYHADGRVDVQRVDDLAVSGASAKDVLIEYTYDAAGVLREYEYHRGLGTGSAQTDVYAYDYSMEFGGLKQKSITVTHFQSGVTRPPGVTTNYYDSRGQLQRETMSNGTIFRTRNFGYDAEGHMIVQRESTDAATQSGGAQNYYYANGRQVGTLGAGTLAAEEFSFTYTPISASYPSASPGTYVVNEGDTLAGIAYAVFGDSSLWYLIADANSIGIGPTTALPTEEIGKVYRIPNVVTNLHSNSNTFKPYNSAEMIGSNTPVPGLPPPPPEECASATKIVATVVIAAVVVAATVYTGGLASAALGGGAFGAIIGAGVGAAAGNAAGQLVGMGLGQQEGFDGGRVLAAGFAGAFTGVAGSVTTGLSGVAKGFATVAQGYVASQVSAGVQGQDVNVWSPLVGMGTQFAVSTVLGPLFNNLGKWGGALQQMAGSALNLQTGWVFNDRSRDWASIAGQAANAFTYVAVGGGGSSERKEVKKSASNGRVVDQPSPVFGNGNEGGVSQVIERDTLIPGSDEVMAEQPIAIINGRAFYVERDPQTGQYIPFQAVDDPTYQTLVVGPDPSMPTPLEEFQRGAALVWAEQDAQKAAQAAVANLIRDHGPKLADLQQTIDYYRRDVAQGNWDSQRVVDAAKAEMQGLIDAYSPPPTCQVLPTFDMSLGQADNALARSSLPSLPSMSNYMDPRSVLVDADVYAYPKQPGPVKLPTIPENIIPTNAQPKGDFTNQLFAEKSVRTSVGNAYSYDGDVNGLLEANDLHRLARGGYKRIVIGGGVHANAQGVGIAHPEFIPMFKDMAAEVMADHPGVKIQVLDLTKPDQLKLFQTLQRGAAGGTKYGARLATLAAYCNSVSNLPSSPPGEPTHTYIQDVERRTSVAVPPDAKGGHYLIGGVQIASGTLSIINGVREDNRALSVLGITGGAANVAGGVSWIYGVSRGSTRAISMASKFNTLGNWLTAPVTIAEVARNMGAPGEHANRSWEENTYNSVIDTGKLTGIFYPPAALVAIGAQVVVEPVAREVSEYATPKFIGAMSEGYGIPADILWRWH